MLSRFPGEYPWRYADRQRLRSPPQPARHWVEALPVGNGRLGAMIFGGVTKERIQLNEDILALPQKVRDHIHSHV